MDRKQLAFRIVAGLLSIAVMAWLAYTINLKILTTHQQHKLDSLQTRVDSLSKIINPVEEQKDSIARLLDIERVKADTIN